MEKKVAWLYIISTVAVYFFIGYLLLVIKSPAQSLGNLGLDALVLLVLLYVAIFSCPMMQCAVKFSDMCGCNVCIPKKKK